MSSRSLSNLGSLAIKLIALVVALCFLGDLARAQDEPYPKWEAFGGYSFIYPNTRLHAINPIINANQEANPKGIGVGLTYNFNHWFGLTADFSGTLWGSGETPAQLAILDDARFYNLSIGPKLTYRRKHFAPFIEGLVGWHRLSEDKVPLVGSVDTFGFMLGGGIDVPLSKHFGLRLLRADFVWSDHQFEPSTVVDTTGVRGLRGQSGVTFMWGYPPEVAPVLACSVSPGEVMAGEPVTVTATPSGFRAGRTITYSWASTGGKVSGAAAQTTVDTTGITAGSYTVSAHATDNKHNVAECSSSFAVKPASQNPPVVSCTPNPGSVMSGEESVITCTCTSPDNRPVSFSAWNASSGKLTPSGNTARLDTAGASVGVINVGTTCGDDRGLTAMGSAAVNVSVPSTPQARNVSQCAFSNPAKPARVDNACKAALDQVADLLQHDPNSKAVIIGETDTGEKGKDLAAQRAVNARAYLTAGENQKGIDPSRVEVRTGAGGMRIEIWIVPEGATFNEPGTTAVDETRVRTKTVKPRK
jgi:hypothetical protein